MGGLVQEDAPSSRGGSFDPSLSRLCCASAAKDSRDGKQTTGLEKDVTSKTAKLVKTESGGKAPFWAPHTQKAD